MLARAIVSLYYSYNTTYIVNLNLIIYLSPPGFGPGSQGPKSATLPLCYTPLTGAGLVCLHVMNFDLRRDFYNIGMIDSLMERNENWTLKQLIFGNDFLLKVEQWILRGK